MTETDWKNLKEELNQFRKQILVIDGYTISVQLVRYNDTKLCFEIYVNGEVRQDWLLEESVEAQRFFWKRTLPAPKGQPKETYYSPYFFSFRNLKIAFTKNNKAIEWLKNS